MLWLRILWYSLNRDLLVAHPPIKTMCSFLRLRNLVLFRVKIHIFFRIVTRTSFVAANRADTGAAFDGIPLLEFR